MCACACVCVHGHLCSCSSVCEHASLICVSVWVCMCVFVGYMSVSAWGEGGSVSVHVGCKYACGVHAGM